MMRIQKKGDIVFPVPTGARMMASSIVLDVADGVFLRSGDFVATINAYFDESERGRWFCVAGYVFKKSRLKLFERHWRIMLADYSLPYFRMSACNAHKKPFDSLSETQCIAVATKAIELIKEYSAVGFAIAVNPASLEQTLKGEARNGLLSTAYEHCVWTALVAVRSWVDETRQKGQIAYFFESGCQHQTKANRLMQAIFAKSNLRDKYRYQSHSFIPKASYPEQAADLLAWQFMKECTRLSEGAKRAARKDYASLVCNEGQHYVCLAQPDDMYRAHAEMLKAFPVSSGAA